MNNELVQCRCGITLMRGQLARHRQGAWHGQSEKLKELRARGLSYAEIARQIGFTRSYICIMFKKFKQQAAEEKAIA